MVAHLDAEVPLDADEGARRRLGQHPVQLLELFEADALGQQQVLVGAQADLEGKTAVGVACVVEVTL